MPDLTNLGSVKAWLAIKSTDTAADVLLSGLISATSADFLRAIERLDFLQNVYTEVREGDGGPRLALRHWPIGTIESVTILGTSIAASADGVAAGWYVDATLDPERLNILYLAGGAYFTDAAPVVVKYTAGYPSPPNDVAQAVVDWVAARYRGRPGIGVNSAREAGGEHVTNEKPDDMPPNVASVVKRYKREWPSLNKYRDDREYKITRINRTTTTTERA